MNSFIRRTASSLLLTGVFLWILLSGGEAAWMVLTAVSAAAAYLMVLEFQSFFPSMASLSGFQCRIARVLASSAALGISYGLGRGISFVEIFPRICIVILVVLSIQMIFIRKDIDTLHGFILSNLAIFIFVLPALHLLPLCFADRSTGLRTAAFLIFVTKSGDIGAYLFGTLTAKLMRGGNHKMIPGVSPKKSWEGFFAGLFFAVGTAFLCRDFLGGFGNIGIGMLGLLLYFGGVAGDLMESSLKRSASVKDSGSVLPGIGGILDLSDSLVLNTPLFYYLINMEGFAA